VKKKKDTHALAIKGQRRTRDRLNTAPKPKRGEQNVEVSGQRQPDREKLDFAGKHRGGGTGKMMEGKLHGVS